MNLDPEKLATERGLMQTNATETLLPIIDKVIAANDNVVADFKAGKEAALQFLVGQVMKETKGSANPKVVADLLKENLN